MEWIEASPEISEEIDTMIRNYGIRGVREAGTLLQKSRSSPLTERDIEREVGRRLSKYITNGLVQLSIEQVKQSDEYRHSLQGARGTCTILLHKLLPLDLPEYVSRITFSLKSGSAEIWRTESAFAIRSVVSLNNSRITLEENKFREFRFGSLSAAMSIYLKKDQVEEAIHSFSRDITIPGMMAAEQP